MDDFAKFLGLPRPEGKVMDGRHEHAHRQERSGEGTPVKPRVVEPNPPWVVDP